MKALIVLLFSVFAGSIFAQINAPEKPKPCWTKSQERSKNRFAEWECGKLAGVLDCNDKLEMDPTSNIVVTKENHKPYTGLCETCHMNGMLERTVRFVNGRTEGSDTTKYRSGCTMVIRSHVAGVEHGNWKYYFDSTGYLSWEKNYNMGQLEGMQYTFRYNGDTLTIDNYVENVLEGASYTFNVNKANDSTYLEKKAMYKKGVLEGPFLVYNTKGVVIEETNFKEGQKHGVFRYYYDDGTLLRTENWDMNRRNGEFKTVYYDQSLQSIENYKKSNGKTTQYLTADIYKFLDEKSAMGIGKLLYNKADEKKLQAYADSAGFKLDFYNVRDIKKETDPILKKAKIGKGVNKPAKSGKIWVVINLTDIKTVGKMETREGWFEERFPDGKLKRRALYKGDILVEETVYDQLGKIVSQYGVTQSTGKEDDAMPTTKGKKEKTKKKKE